jgi:hypothetical protein
LRANDETAVDRYGPFCDDPTDLGGSLTATSAGHNDGLIGYPFRTHEHPLFERAAL